VGCRFNRPGQRLALRFFHMMSAEKGRRDLRPREQYTSNLKSVGACGRSGPGELGRLLSTHIGPGEARGRVRRSDAVLSSTASSSLYPSLLLV